MITLSHSDISNYLQCKRKWNWSYLLDYSEPDKLTGALAIGSRVHAAIEAVSNAVDSTAIFADYNEATADTPCGLSVSNFDLAEHAFSSSIDPLGNYFSYHSSQFEPDGANDAQVVDTGIDASLDTVKNSVMRKPSSV